MTENELREKVVVKAKSYLGFNEKRKEDDIIIRKYNDIISKGMYVMGMSDSWCAAFASVVGVESGMSEIIPIECSCERMIDKFKKMGCWEEDGKITPDTGDYIFYNWDDSTQANDGWSDHVGIVLYTTSTTITVIEGNMNDEVGLRTIKLGWGYIRGYGKPNYKALATKPDEPVTEFKLGDVVELLKGEHYTSSYFSAKKHECKPGKAKITAINLLQVHPYHLVSIEDGCTVHGWVDAGAIKQVDNFETTIRVGDKVKVTNAVTYTGQKFKVWHDEYNVIEASGNRIVIGKGKTVTCAIHIKNLKKV